MSTSSFLPSLVSSAWAWIQGHVTLSLVGTAALAVGTPLVKKRYQAWDRQRDVRRRLYKELTVNWMKLRVGIGCVESCVGDDLPLTNVRIAFVPLVRDYYDHARKDMDVYCELRESGLLDLFYDRVPGYNKSLDEVAEEDFDFVIWDARSLSESIETNFAHGPYDLKLAKKVMGKKQFSELAERVKEAPTALERARQSARTFDIVKGQSPEQPE